MIIITLLILATAANFACAVWGVVRIRRANRTAIVASRLLSALRRNAYLRTEKGHLRRYAECSDQVQIRAEHS